MAKAELDTAGFGNPLRRILNRHHRAAPVASSHDPGDARTLLVKPRSRPEPVLPEW